MILEKINGLPRNPLLQRPISLRSSEEQEGISVLLPEKASSLEETMLSGQQQFSSQEREAEKHSSNSTVSLVPSEGFKEKTELPYLPPLEVLEELGMDEAYRGQYELQSYQRWLDTLKQFQESPEEEPLLEKVDLIL